MTTAALAPAGRLVAMSAGHVIVGVVLSTTVIVALHESDAPWLSTTVSVTLLGPTPYGPASVKVQRGTQTGTVYRLRGKGLPRLGESGRGDLHVRVLVWTPTKLTAEQAKLFEQLAKVEGKERLGKEA